MIGALATIEDPRRFAKLVLLTPSPCYIDDCDYRGGFSRADIDDLLESLEQNFLGWSRAMAPVIMGTPDRPALQDELADTFCRNDPEHARVFARATFLSDNRSRSVPDIAAHPGDRMQQRRDRPARGRCIRSRTRSTGASSSRWMRSAIVPTSAPQPRPRGHLGVRQGHVSDPGVDDFWDSAPSGHVIAHPDGRIIRANATLARWLGYEPDALRGMSIQRSVDRRRSNSLRHPFRAVVALGSRSQRCHRGS